MRIFISVLAGRGVQRHAIRAALGVLLLLGTSGAALAVTQTPQAWTNNVVPGTFPNKEAALAAVHAKGGVYALAENLEKVTQWDTASSYAYGANPRAPEIGEWDNYIVQFALTNPHASEQAAVDSVLAWAEQNAPGCGGGSVSTNTDWYAYKQYLDSGIESDSTKFYDLVYPVNPGCTRQKVKIQALRSRPVQCSAGLTWSSPSKQCERKGIAILTSRPFTCSTCDLEHNPVNVNTGDKYEAETDISLPWITFTRHYHSSHDLPGSPLGSGWTHSLNLSFDPNGGNGGGGMVNESGASIPFQSYESTDGAGWTYTYLAEGYTVESPEATYLFASQRLARITRRDGNVIRLTYDSLGRLSTVAHSTGRALSFAYDPTALPSVARLMSISTQGAELVRYSYDSQGRLSAAQYPDGSSRRYHYEDTRFPYLTGITDENGARFATFTYDANGWATSSEHAGGLHKGTFLYGADGSTTYTDANGQTRTYRFDVVGPYRKINRIEGADGIRTTTYEVSGIARKRPVQTVDKRGTQTTYSYVDDYDSVAGNIRRTTVVEGVGTPSTRTTVYTRDRTAATLLKEVRAGLETTYTRNARRQPISVTRREIPSGAVRTTSMTYCEQAGADSSQCPLVGLLLSVDGPRTDVSDLTTYVYYPADDQGCATGAVCRWRKGDLWKVTTPGGQVTETLAYDAAGRVASAKDASGVITDFEYDLRGRFVARTVRGTN